MKATWSLVFMACLLAVPATAADAAPQSARQVFLRLCHALAENHPERARKFMLTAAEVAEWAGWRFRPATYQRRVERFISGLGAELRAGVHLEAARLADTLFIPAGKKNRRALVLAIVHAEFAIPGSKSSHRVLPFFLVAGPQGWKLWLRR